MRRIRLPGGGAASRAGPGPAPPQEAPGAGRPRRDPGTGQCAPSRRQRGPGARPCPSPPSRLGPALPARPRPGQLLGSAGERGAAAGRVQGGRARQSLLTDARCGAAGAGAAREVPPVSWPGGTRERGGWVTAPGSAPPARAGALRAAPAGISRNRPVPQGCASGAPRKRESHSFRVVASGRDGRTVSHARDLQRFRGRGGSGVLPHLLPAAAAARGVQERTVNKSSWYCSRGYSACRVKSVV